MAAKNALDKRRCNSSEDETQYSSRDYGDNNDGDNTLLAVDSHSVSSSSSEEYGGYVNNGLQSDEDSETGNMDVSQIVETVLRQPVSPALRISESSDVHVGPSLTYNGPVTINVTVQPQSEHQATPPQSDPQLECQLELRNQIQPQLQTEHPPEQQPISHAQIQSQTQIQHPPQQQPLQTQNEIREPPRQQPLSQTLDEPLPHTQQPRLQQPQTMVQRNLQMYGQGVSLNLKENTENEQEIKPGRSQESGQKVKNKKDKRCKDTKDCSSLPSKNDELPKRPYKPQNSSEEQISGPCQHTLGTSTDSLPSRASFGHTERTSIAATTVCSCIQPRNKRSSGT
ncbi:pinin-like isoform X2 [Schistocerca americana]|uniref:pinin-like isoform X2 n=1 Tax=Schistocerca americana TaxID=7009 RepID=UPI001F4F13B0|nr:pinin-like isoform X2 [Schistocerca americana]